MPCLKNFLVVYLIPPLFDICSTETSHAEDVREINIQHPALLHGELEREVEFSDNLRL